MPTREQAIAAIIAFGSQRHLTLSHLDFLSWTDEAVIGEANMIEFQNHWSRRMEEMAQQVSGPEARMLPKR